MRKLLLLAALFLAPFSASATTTVTGTLQNLGTGTVGSAAFVRFWLRGCGGNQPRVNGTAIIAPSNGGVFFFDLVANSSGVISGTVYSTRDSTGLLAGEIECGGSKLSVWYGMQTFVGGKGGPETPIHAKNGATLNLTSVTPITTNPVVTAPTGDSTYLRLDAGNSPVTGPIQFTGNVTATAGQNTFNAWKFNGIIFVDGIHFTTLASALATVPVGGALVIDTFVEAFTVNPFASTANPVWVQFGAGNWTTTVPIVHTANQWLTGAGPQQTHIKAVAGFSSTTLGVVTLGNGAESHSMFVRDIGIDCNSIANCSGLIFDGAQNPTGASNVVISNYRVDGVRLQQTSAATGAVDLHDMWVYSATGLATTGAGVNISQFSGNVIVENVIQATDHSFAAPSAFKVGGGSGTVTFISDGGEGITDQFLLTGTGAVTVIIGANQVASSSPGVNTVHVGAGVSNYTLINVSQGTSTGAALVDDTRSYAQTGGIPYLTVSGGSTKFDFGTASGIGWIRTPATTVTTADTIQLQAGFTGTNSAYKVLSDAGAIQFSVSNDGRPTFRGGQTGAFKQVQTSDTLTADRTPQYPNGNSATVMVAALVTTAAATDNVTIQGMTASGHCSLTPTNAAAIGAATPPGVTTKAANQITVTHAVTANMNYDVLCTSN